MDKLKKGIQCIKGIGPKKLESFKKLGIYTIEDFLYFFPKEYEDRNEVKKISDVQDNEKTSIKVIVDGNAKELSSRKGLRVTKLPIKDSTGKAYAVFYNNPFLKRIFKINDEVYFYGNIKKNYNEVQIIQPDYELIRGKKTERFFGFIPVYHLTRGITQNELISIQKFVLQEYTDSVNEYLPRETIERNRLCDIRYALRNIHFPSSPRELNIARFRLIFEELLILQLGLLLIKSSLINNNKGISFKWKSEIDAFIHSLPFKLTNSQVKVISEIRSDMEKAKSMYRLIQGDVGSGKTIIAFIALFNAVLNGYQGVLMAPTEILAEQHFQSAKELLCPFGVKVQLLTGSLSKKRSEEITEQLKKGEINIIIGTHALIQERVVFNNLGIVITDEQHRFGVKQREMLSNKGFNPDVLVMTATPIPRTLALILYGDLDISVIDELPPGRKNIKTFCVKETKRSRVYEFIKKQVSEGRQAYIVAPLIDESEEIEAISVQELFQELKNTYLKECSIGLLHGKLKTAEKEKIIKDFYSGNIQILVSTTVIEVGVNVPNASIMVIENCERFGLAQLHQLRGRVGRGIHQSYCILINYSMSSTSKERMHIMESTNNGFVIAEKDLELRGPGDFFGTRQHGLPALKIANLFKHMKVLQQAQEEAEALIRDDHMLVLEQHKNVRRKIIEKFFNDEYSINL